MELKSVQNYPYSKYFLAYLAFSVTLRPWIIELLADIFWKSHHTFCNYVFIFKSKTCGIILLRLGQFGAFMLKVSIQDSYFWFTIANKKIRYFDQAENTLHKLIFLHTGCCLSFRNTFGPTSFMKTIYWLSEDILRQYKFKHHGTRLLNLKTLEFY